MSRIYVAFSGLDTVEKGLTQAASRIEAIQRDFQHNGRHLDWDIGFRADIRRTVNQLSKKMEQYAEVLRGYQQFIEEAGGDYKALDSSLSAVVSGRIGSIRDVPICGPGGQLNHGISELSFPADPQNDS